MARQSQPCLTRLLVAAGFVAIVLQPVSAGPLSEAMPHVKGTRAIVLEQLEQLLAADKELQLIGQGSWLKTPAELAAKSGAASRQYKDPLVGGTSDHDLRLVMEPKREMAARGKWASLSDAERAAIQLADEADMARKWKAVQEDLRRGIAGAFPEKMTVKELEVKLAQYGFTATDAAKAASQGRGAVIDKILQSVNIYSPPQLLKSIVDEKTAADVFRKLGTVPNLAGKEIEGVWGAGAAAATQEFEAGGKLFYSGTSGVRTGFVDLVHAAEKYGPYSFGGAANMSVQWAEKAAQAIGSGDMSLVAKYLKRLKGTWGLAIRKGGLRSDAMRTSLFQLNELIAAAERGEAAALESGLTLQKFLRTARMQSSVLGQLARNPRHVDREIMLAILEAQPASRWETLGSWFRDVWPSAESLAVFERALQGVFLVMSTWQVSGTWGERGMEEALRQAGVEGAMLVSLPVGSLLALTNSLIENAKSFGYNSAVKPQEWREFLAGISSVTGYEGETHSEISVERLAVECVSADEVSRAVEKQAYNISRLKETGVAEESEATKAAREEIRVRLIRNMTPIVQAEWLRARKVLLSRYLELAVDLDERMDLVTPVVSPQPDPVTIDKDGPADASLVLSLGNQLAPITDQLAQMEAAIRPLGGRQHIVVFGYRGTVRWSLDGRTREVSTTTNLKDLLAPVRMTVPGSGTYTGTAVVRLEVRAPSLGLMDEARDVFDAQPIIGRAYEFTVPIAVTVVRGGVKVFREWWDKEQKVVKREYEYVDVAGALPGYEKKRVGFERIYFENGKLAYEARRRENQFEGSLTRYWANGQVFDRVIYKDGSREGAYEAFESDGKPRVEGQFKGDRKAGHWKYFTAGKLETEGDYAPEGTSDSLPYNLINLDRSDVGLYAEYGAKGGTWIAYFPSGKKRSERDLSAAAAFSRSYFDNERNSLESECTKAGCRYWDSDGKEIKRLASHQGGTQQLIEGRLAGDEARGRERARDEDAATGRCDEDHLGIDAVARVDGGIGPQAGDRHVVGAQAHGEALAAAHKRGLPG